MATNLWSGHWNGRTPVGDDHRRARQVISPSGGIMRGKFPSRKNGRLVHHEGLLDEDFQQFFEGRLVLRLGLTALQLFIEAHAERPEKAREHGLDQRLFRAEVIIHRSQIDASLAGDQTQ